MYYKANLRLPSFLFLISFLFLSSCNKILDLFKGDAIATIPDCNIVKIIQRNSPTDYPITYKFYYNKHGYPIKILNDKTGTGSPNLFFKYDKKWILTEFIQLYSNGTDYERWIKYITNLDGIIIRDTTRIFGVYGESAFSEIGGIYVHEYKYDSLGRIIEVFQKDLLFGIEKSFFYSYSNSVEEGKININRTNPIWMFINKNYSVNQYPEANEYNNYHLPTKFWGVNSVKFLDISLDYSEIYYSCN